MVLYAPAVGGGSASVANPSTADLSASAAWQAALAAAKGTPAPDLSGSNNVVKYSFDHGDAVQTDINGNLENGRPQIEFTVDRYTNTVTVTQLNPNNGKPAIDPHTHTPYQEVITEPHPFVFHASGNLPTADLSNPFLPGVGDMGGVVVRAGAPLSANNSLYTDTSNVVTVTDGGEYGPDGLATPVVGTPPSLGLSASSTAGEFQGIGSVGTVVLNTYNETTDPYATGAAAANKNTMVSSYLPSEDSFPSYFTSKPPFDWTHIINPLTWF